LHVNVIRRVRTLGGPSDHARVKEKHTFCTSTQRVLKTSENPKDHPDTDDSLAPRAG
jgi:hypothetical protein